MIVPNQRLRDYEPFTEFLQYADKGWCYIGIVFNHQTKWVGRIEDVFDTEWINYRVTNHDDTYLGRAFFVTQEETRQVSDYYPCGLRRGIHPEVNCNKCPHCWRDCGGC